MDYLKKLISKYILRKKNVSKEESKFTGIEIKMYKDGMQLTYAVGPLDQLYVYKFPPGTVLKTSDGAILTGFTYDPHLERIY